MQQSYLLILLVLGLIFVSSIRSDPGPDESAEAKFKALEDRVARLEQEAKITQKKIEITEGKLNWAEEKRWKEKELAKKESKQPKPGRVRIITGRRSTPSLYN